jgi:DNA-binding beta-propeller fold protein YncE
VTVKPLAVALGPLACLAALASWGPQREGEAPAEPLPKAARQEPRPPSRLAWARPLETQGPSARVALRRPVAAAFLDDRTLGVANQRSGTVSLVDVARGQVRDEVEVGKHLTGLAVLPDRKHILVTDDELHELIVLAFDGARLTVRARLAVGPYPASVAVQPDGSRATVACLWSRRLDVIDLTPLPDGPPRLLHTLRLPFAPREQCLLPRKGLVAVADAFGGRLAVVDAVAGRLVAEHELTGHNLRGLAASADGSRLLASHQILDQKAPTTRENIVRGALMANVVRSIPLDRLLTPGADLEKDSRVLRLGEVGAGAGDPAGVAVLAGGRLAVALSGVDEVAFLNADGKQARRAAVERRPTALVAGGEKGPLVVVNTFADSLSLLDAGGGAPRGTISLGPQPELSYRERGELLFYDARLSRDGWMSCHSCHSDGHTCGLLADTLGDGTFGTPKRTLTLLGTGLTDPWGWDGRTRYLFDQVRKSLADTMHDPTVTEAQVGDLSSFLNALPMPPPAEPPTSPEDRARVERGRAVFETNGCARCHVPPLTYSTHEVHDVGFADEKGLRKFNPPSLRGVGHGGRFLHDGRAASLEEVFAKYRHKVGDGLPPDDLADLLRFLRSL